MSASSLPTAGQLQYLVDRFEIQDVIARYARGQDDHQGDDGDILADWDHVFTDDATVDYESAGVPAGATYRELAEWMRGGGGQGRMGVFSGWQHNMGPSSVEIDGDTATAQTSVLASHQVKPAGADDAGTVLLAACTFQDELRRTADGWRISFRRNLIHWIDDVPRVPSAHA